jgi:hemerythrin-like domain-containing protein
LISAFECDARIDAQRLWTEFDSELQAHFALEEKEIFPEFAKAAPAEAAALIREHAELCDKLGKLGLGVDLHLTRAEAVSDFVHALRSHAKREDALLYRWAQTNLAAHTHLKLRTVLLGTIRELLGVAQP